MNGERNTHQWNSQLERIVILMEECAEVQQVCAKILRHGIDSHSPLDPNKTSNKDLLERELGDLTFIIEFMKSNSDISAETIAKLADSKRDRIAPYLHFNTVV